MEQGSTFPSGMECAKGWNCFMSASEEIVFAIIRKAQRKLDAAKRSFEHQDYEDAASRSYYAAFHAISAVLASKGLSFSSHMQTLSVFNREFIKTGLFPSDTFRKIQRLYDDRQLGDYDCTIDIDESTAQKDIQDADWLLESCRSFLQLQ